MHKYLIGSLMVLLAGSSLAATPSEQFGVSKWPVTPTLSINTQPDLCDFALTQAKTLFNSSNTDLDIENAVLSKIPALEWLPITPGAETLFTLRLDLEANGSKQIILYRDLPFNWKGHWHYAYVFQDENNFNRAKDQIIKNWSDLSSSQEQYSTDNAFNAVGYFPSSKVGDKEIASGDVWASHALFKYKNYYYFFQASTHWGRMENTGTEIYQLHSNGRIETRCKISLPNEKEQYQKFISTPKIASFIATIRAIGAGGPDIGTAHYGPAHDGRAIQAEHRAAYRPWALDQANSPYYVYDARFLAYLEEWSLLSLWNRREYQTLLEQMDAAESAETLYLKSTFGLTEEAAKQKAKTSIQQLLAARILIPSGYDSSDSSSSVYFPLNKFYAIFLKRDKAKLDALQNKTTFELDPYTKIERDQLLAFAIEWPYGLNKLLSAGANPNTVDDIQKTPLMLAAHLNRPDAIRALLKAGANVNAKTKFEAAFSQAAITNGRTALMYAAENANPLAIKLLIDAGADLNAKDSNGHGIADYLAKNPRFTDEEKKSGVAALTTQVERFSKASFDCNKASTAIEKAICANEVLGMYDNELSRAYLAAKNRVGPSLVGEQQNWLRRRNTICKDDSTLSDCLAEITRTRIRYLHKLLSEKN